MPAILLALLGSSFGKWVIAHWVKIAEYAIVAGVVISMVLYGRHEMKLAAMVPGLQSQIKQKDLQLKADATLATNQATALQKISVDRDAYYSALQTSYDAIHAIELDLEKEVSNAAIKTNPVCKPSDNDRLLRNNAVAKFKSGASSNPKTN